MTTTSSNGRWQLRFTSDTHENDAGYSNASSRWELVEAGTGRSVRTWTGQSTSSPWDASSQGVSDVRFDGDAVVVTDSNGEQRIELGQKGP